MIIQGVNLNGTTVIDHPPVINSGLQQYYDIGNASSYSGSGSSVTDLSGQSYGTASLLNTPTYNSAGNRSYLSFNGTDEYFLTPNLLSMVNDTLNVTLETWVRTSTDNGVVVTEQGALPPNSGWHDSQIELVSSNVKMAMWPYTMGGGIVIGAATRNQWQQYTLVYNDTTKVLTGYINGTTTNSYSITRSFGGTGLWYGIALTDFTNLGDGSYLACDWSIFRVYNRALSAAEVLQNYQADSWRYT